MGSRTNFIKQQKRQRIGEEKLNNQNCLMKIVEYNSADDIIVEFQDKYKAKVHTQYKSFLNGSIKNPYKTSVCGVGIIGVKYPMSIDKKQTKEYIAWCNMLNRCYGDKTLKRYYTYKDVTCCDEWLYYENFYEWLHNQENFNKYENGDKWAVDKDILIKGNKVYSPETCCLVPHNINMLFVKNNKTRGNLPIGVHFDRKRNKYRAECRNPFINKVKKIGRYQTLEEAFQSYKKYKENIIKQVAEYEYSKSNITEQCYKAMMNYKVEIDD